MELMRKAVSSLWFWYGAAAALSVLTASPALGLCLGALLGLIWGNPERGQTNKASKQLLQWAVSLLGFSMELSVILKVGLASAWITMISIGATLLLGTLLGRALKIDSGLSVLLSSGTAICGGSAIAAMSSALGSSQLHTAVAMAVIFLLNGLALIVFPPVGQFFQMTQEQFGFWAALAIHDTSSVVGAGAIYGAAALGVATTVKLTRALWILPLSFIGAKIRHSKGNASIPKFLIGFLAAATLRSLIPAGGPLWISAALVGKRMMVGTLFLIGAGLSLEDLRTIGLRPLIMALILWGLISLLSFSAVMAGWMPQISAL